MSDTSGEIGPAPQARQRLRVFVDYWNFQLSLNQREATAQGKPDVRFKVDWKGLGPWLAKRACDAIGLASYSFDGVIVYASHDPKTEDGRKFHRWMTTWLDRQPGVTVECRERRPKALPKCPVCHQQIGTCPHCGKRIVSTIEKGVDTLIATDMIRLAWEDAYDLGVLATSDSDLVPAVEFLMHKGHKIVQAGFPPAGIHLATACWASFDVFQVRNEIERNLAQGG